MRNSFSNANPFTKLIFSLFIILVSFLLTFIIALIIALPIFHISFSELSTVLSDYNDPNNLNFLRYLQTIQAIGLFIIPAFIIGYLFHNQTTKYLGFNKKVSVNTIFLTIFIFLISIPIINYLGILNGNMKLPDWLGGVEEWMKEKEESAKLITESFLKMESLSVLAFNLLMIAILPAIGEELIFRGILQRIFSEWTKNIHWGIIISAFLFSAMHFQFYGFLPRFMLGVLLGYLFYWSGSIWIPILGHFVNNSVAIIVYYFYADKAMEGLESIGQETIAFVGLSIAIFTISIFAFYKENKLKVKS